MAEATEELRVSRVGKRAIEIPKGVTVSIAACTTLARYMSLAEPMP